MMITPARKLGLATALGAVLTLGMATATVAKEHMDPDKKMPHSGVKLMTELAPENEVDAPGDTDGSGIFEARLNPGSGQMCYEVKVDDLDDVTGAHIHRGVAGVSGPVLVTFGEFDDGKVDACLTIDTDLAKEIIRDPNGFYVNVHTDEFPAGAIRGQIMR